MAERTPERQGRLTDAEGGEIPTLAERPRLNYWLQTYGLVLGPHGSECIVFEDVEDVEDFSFDSWRSIDEEWTSVGVNSFATQHAVDIGYEAAWENGIEVVLPHHWASVDLGGPYAMFLGGAFVAPGQDPSVPEIRAVYASAVDCDKLELWSPPCNDVCGKICAGDCDYLEGEYLTVRLRLYDPDDLYYLKLERYDRYA